MNDRQIEKLKYIWAYMVMEGKPTSGNFSYYGGGYESLNPKADFRLSFGDAQKSSLGKLISDINEIGIDWDRTGLPVYQNHAEFADSFSPAINRECLLGIIVLNNDRRYTLGVSDAEQTYIDAVDAFRTDTIVSDYVKQVFKD